MIHTSRDALKLAILGRDATIEDALRSINDSGLLMACFVGSSGKLEGILTDSDIRRLLLAGDDLTARIGDRFNPSPVVGSPCSHREKLLEICEISGVRELPLVDDKGILVDIFIRGAKSADVSLEKDVPSSAIVAARKCAMFISAGGKGLRLRSVVSDRPKPLALVGGVPIIQTIIKRAARFGVQKFYISVNHLGNMIEDHLASDVYDGIDIEIVRESKPLGTAGAIGFVASKITAPLIVTNGDILSAVPFDKLITTHDVEMCEMTCTVRPHKTIIPYGVLEIHGFSILQIEEKPCLTHYVNSGIYVLSPSLVRTIQPDVYCDMPDVVNRLLKAGKRVVPFLLHEYWVDIGSPSDFSKANSEFKEFFKEEVHVQA